MKGWTNMIDTRKRRPAVFLFFLLTLGAVLLFCKMLEENTCMGVPILSEQEQAELDTYVYEDLSGLLQFNGQRAAVDIGTSTIYIAQDIQQNTKKEDLRGILRLTSPSLQLSFAPDAAFDDLAAAVKNGHEFKLNVAYGHRKYMQYNLIFTTFPVLRLDGEIIEMIDKYKALYQGDMCLWTPKDPEMNSYSVKTSMAQWHVRGGWSSNLAKTPFKLDLKKKNGLGKNMSLMGLGSDDDWILNPMNADDTKLKERVFSTMWNQRVGQVDWNQKMSRGEYMEVVINQEYWGLYQIQRRIDRKFLDLGAEDILLKRTTWLDASTIQTTYEITHSAITEEQTYEIIRGFYQKQDPDILNMDNFLDVNLFCQWASAIDNINKNMFFLLQKDNGQYQLSLLPWDTDMSWGAVWNGSRFIYDFEASKQNNVLRVEYAWLQKYYPDLNQQMANRWFELREKLLTMENMTAVMEQEQAILDASGVLKRDTDRWGLYHEGEDSLENLYKSMEARLEWADAYYSQYLQ